MSGKRQSRNLPSRSHACAAIVALAMVLVLTMVLTPTAQAQTFTVIHSFTWGADGSCPYGDLTMDAAGNLYGVTEDGFFCGALSAGGTVFKLSNSGSSWALTTLYSFAGGDDGSGPQGGVTVVSDGTIYGTTYTGGGTGCFSDGCGTIFHLQPSPAPPKTALAPWNETVLYRFNGGSDGSFPLGDVTWDQAGNLYGVTAAGGSIYQCPEGCGVVYQLTPTDGGWTETALYSFQGSTSEDGEEPVGGVVFDSSGDLYGVTAGGSGYWGENLGTVFQLSRSGSGWTEQIIYSFTGRSDGGHPWGGLIIDASGNLYGSTQNSGSAHGGTVFEVTPTNGGWTFNTLYGLSCGTIWSCWGPMGKLVLDGAGNLYGTTAQDGAYGKGSVFKLTHGNGGWTYTSLHDFTGGSDGWGPNGGLVLDKKGNLYGTASAGGIGNCVDRCGVVFEITP